MANVTDPLARAIHGTNPQNLIEYITRQRIYDSQYWKEECFGLTAEQVTEKAALQIQAIGGNYGGNSQPTRFLSLILKLLQIQPESGIIDELISNEEFKYVRILGAFYLRLTGRPAEIYEKLEPLYNDYRKIRYRNPSDWSLIHVDEFIHDLFKEERVCGIALPRLPKRDMLVEAGYLDGPRVSALYSSILGHDVDAEGGIKDHEGIIIKIHKQLVQMARDGNAAAKSVLEARSIRYDDDNEQADKIQSNHKENHINEGNLHGSEEILALNSRSRSRSRSRSKSRSRSRSWGRQSERKNGEKGYSSDRDRYIEREVHIKEDKHRSDWQKSQKGFEERDIRNADMEYSKPSDDVYPSSRTNSTKRKDRGYNLNVYKADHSNRTKKSKKSKSKYGSLFKSSSSSNPNEKVKDKDAINPEKSHGLPDNDSEEYWNQQRALLGLKPLRK